MPQMRVFTPEEVEARTIVMYKSYNAAIIIEAKTAIVMVNTLYMPAVAADLKTYEGTPFVGKRLELYSAIMVECEALEAMVDHPSSPHAFDSLNFYKC